MAALARAVRTLSQRAVTTQRVHALSTLSRSHTLSTAAAAIDEDAEWSVAFKDATDAFSGEDTHEVSAQRMRELVKSGLLRHTDLRDRPDRFFEAHRAETTHASDRDQLLAKIDALWPGDEREPMRAWVSAVATRGTRAHGDAHHHLAATLLPTTPTIPPPPAAPATRRATRDGVGVGVRSLWASADKVS